MRKHLEILIEKLKLFLKSENSRSKKYNQKEKKLTISSITDYRWHNKKN